MAASHMCAIAMKACKSNDLVLPLCDQMQTLVCRGLRQALVPTGFAGIGHLQQIAKDLGLGHQRCDGASVLRTNTSNLDVVLSHGYLLGLKGLHKQKSPQGERAWGGGSGLLSVCHAIRSDGLQLCSMQGITHNGSRWVVV
jgi:hypothetical protein